MYAYLKAFSLFSPFYLFIYFFFLGGGGVLNVITFGHVVYKISVKETVQPHI